MLILILGLILFYAIHAVPMSPDLRAGVVARFGEGAYKGVFSLVSLIAFVLIVVGYGKMQPELGSKNPILWFPPEWMRHVAATLMLPSMILLVAAYTPSRIRTAVGHPMLAAVKVWAFAHLIANGDLASLVLFGSFLAYAVVDRISVKRRTGGGRGPLGAARGTLAGDIVAVVGGLALYLGLLYFAHAWLFGVAPIPALSLV